MKPGPNRDPSRPHSRAHGGKTGREPIRIPDISPLAIPDPLPGMEMTDGQIRIWSQLWESGPATQWGAGDVHAVAMLAILLHKLYTDGSPTRDELTEIRNLRNELGLSPAARDRLGWEIDDD